MMTLDRLGNFNPWVQPAYGFDAQDKPVSPPPGFKIVPDGTELSPSNEYMVFDVYSGWFKPDDFDQRNRHHCQSRGRWTTWAVKL